MDAPQTIRPELLSLSVDQLRMLAPYLWIFGGVIVTMIVGVWRFASMKWPVFLLTIAAVLGSMASSFDLLSVGDATLFNRMLAADSFSNYFNLVFLGSGLLTVFASFRYLDRENLQHPEYYILLLLSVLGMMTLASSLDLVVLFIALELMSLAVYVLVGFRRADRRSNEAAMKYFILGAAASGILLYGIALLYGATGTLNIYGITEFVRVKPEAMTPVFALGAWLVVLGFLFKVASVPFHMWMPDVYEGAPTPITGFMTSGLKAAAFAAFLRVFVSLGYGRGLTEAIQNNIHDILWVSAVLTMFIGNVIALTQTNLKRMLGYSSIAHTGYLLVGMIAGPGSENGYGPVAMYLAVYAIMNLGAFIILTIISAREDNALNLHDLSGLSRRHPWLAFSMAVFLFSMAGIPPTAGFVAKYLLFYAAVQAGEIVLVVLSVLCSAISVYYYLRVLVYMYMREPVGTAPSLRISMWSAAAVALMVLMTIQIGLLPAWMIEAAKKAVTNL